MIPFQIGDIVMLAADFPKKAEYEGATGEVVRLTSAHSPYCGSPRVGVLWSHIGKVRDPACSILKLAEPRQYIIEDWRL